MLGEHITQLFQLVGEVKSEVMRAYTESEQYYNVNYKFTKYYNLESANFY